MSVPRVLPRASEECAREKVEGLQSGNKGGKNHGEDQIWAVIGVGDECDVSDSSAC